ncbi:MAG: CPBP family intramembrane glutamic endopeptidase [Bacillus sp. (in: firmicutes)]
MNLSMLKKAILLISITLISFLLENLKFPKFIFFLKDIPESLTFKIENRIVVIGFVIVLFLVCGKQYKHLFNITLLKDKKSYVWIFFVLVAVVILKQASMGFPGSFGMIKMPQLHPFHLLIVLFRVAVLVPIQEELLYRGLLILVPSKRIQYLMLIVSSILFASIHSNPFQMVWLGFGLGFLAIRFNNIWIPIIAHAIWNLLATFVQL